MDFDLMLTKLDNAEYRCAQDFLDDIDLIANNALKYNSDLQYETNKVCHSEFKPLRVHTYFIPVN